MPDLTARKELSRLFEHHDRGYSSSAEWRTALLDAIMAWHTRFQPPTLSRERVRDILLKHNIFGAGAVEALNDLCALAPPLAGSREHLAMVLKKYGVVVGDTLRCTCAQHAMGYACPELLDALCALLRREEPRPTWCPCIEWIGDHLWREKASGDDVCGWNFCPTCGVPRPAGT